MQTITTTRRVWDKVAKDYVTQKYTLTVDMGALVDLLAVAAKDNKSNRAQLGAGAVVLTWEGKA